MNISRLADLTRSPGSPGALFGSFDGYGGDERRRAAAALLVAMVAGAVTQALFWRTTLGLNFWLWDLLVLAGMVTRLRPAKIRPTAWGAISACVVLGFSVVLYQSDWTMVVAVPSVSLILAILPLLLRARYGLADLARLPPHAFASVTQAPRALRETARLPGIAIGDAKTFRAMTRGLVLGLPATGLFTVLFLGDADFAHSLERIRERIGDVVLFATWSVISAGGYLVTHAVHRAQTPPTNDAELAPVQPPYRAVMEEGAAPPTSRVSVAAWAMVVGQVTLVFAVFVAANVRHLFGGAALVRAAGTLTYAAYLHSGFGELLFATILSVGLVLAGHALVQPKGERDPGGAVPGGKLLATLEGTLLVLTGITVASCWQRLQIYEDAYGASHLRLGVAFVELSVLGVLALTLGKVIFRRWKGHAGAVLALGVAIAVVASGLNTDAYVAKRNLDRAADGKALDLDYLFSLSGDARGAIGHPYLADHPKLAARLEASFCAPREGDLRAFRGLGRCASSPR